MKMDLLSKKDLIHVLEIINFCIAGVATCDDFFELINELKKLLPFEMATALICRNDNRGNLQSIDVQNINYPSEWVDLYIANDYKLVDPVLRQNFIDYRLQYWADTYKRMPPPKKFISLAEDFGLRSGYTFGARNLTGDECSLFSLSGQVVERSARTDALLNIITPHLHQAFSRVNGRGHGRGRSIPLSLREKEILNWVKQGKTSWETSVILNISERTVNFHMQNITRKLNASSRLHAVAIALEENMIPLI